MALWITREKWEALKQPARYADVAALIDGTTVIDRGADESSPSMGWALVLPGTWGCIDGLARLRVQQW